MADLRCPVCHVIHAGWCPTRDMDEQMREAAQFVQPAPINTEDLVFHGRVVHVKGETCLICRGGQRA